MDWTKAATAKRLSLLNSIPQEWRLRDSQIPPPARLRDVTGFVRQRLDPVELDITDTPAHVLLARVRAGESSAFEVTRAFCHRASLAHQLTNCLSEIFFDAALKRAAELDHHLQTTGRPVGPLHGLPVSVKDRFNIDGIDSACGYVSWLNRKKSAKDEGTLVRKLRLAGAILFVKTNVPMSMLMGETNNNIIGPTCNPYNRQLSAGGASGGEGALLALRGSPIGIGSDIAGSVRIPCAFSNIYGLRPSYGRLPGDGLATTLPGLPTAQSVIGPMAPDLSSLITATKWIIDSNCWTDTFDVIDMPWNDDKFRYVSSRSCRDGESDGKLSFAIMYSDGEVLPHPPIQRALKMVAQALEQRGYEVIEWSPPAHAPAANLLFQIFGSTAGQTVRQAINASGEPPIHQLQQWYDEQESEPSSSVEFWKLCELREQYRAQYHAYWMSTRSKTRSRKPVDGVILPVAPSAAVEEGFFSYYAYSAIASVLDYTAGSFPVTFADRTLDMEDTKYLPLNQTDRSSWRTYQKELFDGAPVGLQVMGQRLQEEKVLAMMEAISRALGQYNPSN